MTEAVSARALGMSLSRSPAGSRPELPPGWVPWQSAPDLSGARRWYASAPYDRSKYGSCALEQTISASSWASLCIAAKEQMDLYRELTCDSAK